VKNLLHICCMNIPIIIDCNLKKDYQILIIFGTNIPIMNGRHMTVQVPTSHNICFCITWESGTKEIRIQMNDKRQ